MSNRRPPSRGNPAKSPSRGRTDRQNADAGRQGPRTEAERRAAEVRARRGQSSGGGASKRAGPGVPAETEEWIDEGPVRSEAFGAVGRAKRPQMARATSTRSVEVDAATAEQIRGAVGPQRGTRLVERLGQATGALERDRLDEARRVIKPLADELPTVAAVRRVAGLTAYRLGHWRRAVSELEAAHELDPVPDDLPVIADAYRARRRWSRVDELWEQIRAASPAHHVMAEGRIVAAGAAADRGELDEALRIMRPADRRPKRVREHHLRQWYVLGDLHDRAGDPIAAARFFRQVADADEGFADVSWRLDALGR